MKTYIFLQITFLFFTVVLNSTDSRSQTNTIKETRTISSFTEIEINTASNVFLKQSENESITLEGNTNLVSNIKTYVEDGRLIIENKEKNKSEKNASLNIYINFKDLTKLVNNSVGNVKSENRLNLSSFNLENNSVGNLDIDINCNNLNAEINSVGNVTFTGNVKKANIQNNSVGNLDAFDLTADVLKIENNSVGDSKVNATGEIYIEANGVGNVSYKGSAVLKKSESNGVGKIKKM